MTVEQNFKSLAVPTALSGSNQCRVIFFCQSTVRWRSFDPLYFLNLVNDFE